MKPTLGQFSDQNIIGTAHKQPILVSQATEDELEQQDEIYNVEYSSEEDEPGVSKAQLLFDVIRQLKSGKDLYRISLPAALLAPESMLEYISKFVTPNNFILGYVHIALSLSLHCVCPLSLTLSLHSIEQRKMTTDQRNAFTQLDPIHSIDNRKHEKKMC